MCSITTHFRWINSVWSKIAPNRLAAGRLRNMAIDETTDTKYINFIKYSCTMFPRFVFVSLR